MKNIPEQSKAWIGDFGKEYTDRNPHSWQEINNLYFKRYGLTLVEMNQRFIGHLPKSIKILEIGTNVGTKLSMLQHMGFNSLFGIEIQKYAVEKAKSITHDINIIHASGFDVPFKNDSFDLVFISGVLIHISPNDLKLIMSEAYRCSKQYIWGFEYFSDIYQEIPYRGNKNLMWKGDFAQIYQNDFNNLELIKQEKYKYLENSNIDTMFLLAKIRKITNK